MESLYVLLPLALLLGGVGLALFIWAVKSGQYDDMEGPAHRVLLEDDQEMIPPPPGGEKDDP